MLSNSETTSITLLLVWFNSTINSIDVWNTTKVRDNSNPGPTVGPHLFRPFNILAMRIVWTYLNLIGTQWIGRLLDKWSRRYIKGLFVVADEPLRKITLCYYFNRLLKKMVSQFDWFFLQYNINTPYCTQNKHRN